MKLTFLQESLLGSLIIDICGDNLPEGVLTLIKILFIEAIVTTTGDNFNHGVIDD